MRSLTAYNVYYKSTSASPSALGLLSSGLKYCAFRWPFLCESLSLTLFNVASWLSTRAKFALSLAVVAAGIYVSRRHRGTLDAVMGPRVPELSPQRASPVVTSSKMPVYFFSHGGVSHCCARESFWAAS